MYIGIQFYNTSEETESLKLPAQLLLKTQRQTNLVTQKLPRKKTLDQNISKATCRIDHTHG